MADVTKKQAYGRVRLTRNGLTLYDQVYELGEDDYTESVHHRTVLATNMASPSAISLGGVATGQLLHLTTDRPIQVAINASTTTIPVTECLLLVGAFTAVYLQNESHTNLATVELVVTD